MDIKLKTEPTVAIFFVLAGVFAVAPAVRAESDTVAITGCIIVCIMVTAATFFVCN